MTGIMKNRKSEHAMSCFDFDKIDFRKFIAFLDIFILLFVNKLLKENTSLLFLTAGKSRD